MYENLDKLRIFFGKNLRIYLITNQTAAARNEISYFSFRFKIYLLFHYLIKNQLIQDYRVCFHHPRAAKPFLRKNCECRKPGVKMLHHLYKKYRIDFRKTYLIGDRITDMMAGQDLEIDKKFLILNKRSLDFNVHTSIESLEKIVTFIPVKNLLELCELFPNHEMS
jgi:histidinol phosphatase-like enzyme